MDYNEQQKMRSWEEESHRKNLEWAFMMGERDEELKLSSRTVACHMTLHGTYRGR